MSSSGFGFTTSWGLQSRIVVPVLALIVVVMSTVGYIQHSVSAKDMQDAIDGKADAMSALLQNISGSFIVNYDISTLERFVEHSLKDKEVVYVVFFDDKGKQLTEKVKKPEDVSMYINMEETVKVDERVVGTVSVGFRKDNIEAAKRRSLWLAFGGISAALVLIFGLVWFITRKVTQAVSDISMDMASTGKHLLETAQNISSASDELNASSNNQTNFVQKTATTVSEFDAALVSTSQNAQKSSSLARESEKSAQRGQQVVNELLQSFEMINKSNLQLNEHIHNNLQNLSEIVKVIERIGDQTQVINNIVFQTKLLSFNASVEAARAGEHGRGFAIVAEEVRKLAEMSGEAAKQITSLLSSSIQQATDLAKRSEAEMSVTTKEATAKIQNGAEMVRKAMVAFEEISQNITSTVGMSDEIARATSEQTEGIREINRSMGELSTVITQARGVFQTQSTLANELLTKSEQLDKVTMELRALVYGEEKAFEMEHDDKTKTSGFGGHRNSSGNSRAA